MPGVIEFMHNDKVNIIYLTQEMSYEPMWYIDQQIFYNLIYTSSFNDEQLLEIARLHVKYKHILHRKEVRKCFDYFVTKAKCISVDQLYNITRTLYNERKTEI